MKYIVCDYGFLLDVDCAIGELQTCSILGKEDSTRELVDKFIKDVTEKIFYYKNNQKNDPIIKPLSEKDIKMWYKSYRKMLKNCKKHKIPSWLKPSYDAIVIDLNNFTDSLIKEGLKIKKFE